MGCWPDEPAWWYGRGSLAEVSIQPPIRPPIVTPLPSDDLQAQPAKRDEAQLSLFNPADRAGSLPLPPALIAKLSADEK
jgi:hypothetical protein